MKRHTRPIAATALAAALASTAGAQTPDDFRKLSDKDAAEEFDSYVECLVSRRQGAARSLASAPFGSPSQSQSATHLTRSVDENCLKAGFSSVRLTVRPDVLAGAVAARMLARDYPDLSAIVVRTAVDVETERVRSAQLSVAERFGRCVVWNDPAGVQGLLRAEPGSAAERAAVGGLQHDMGMCLEEGNTLRLDRQFVRNVTAVAAYRLAQQIRPVGLGTERG